MIFILSFAGIVLHCMCLLPGKVSPAHLIHVCCSSDSSETSSDYSNMKELKYFEMRGCKSEKMLWVSMCFSFFVYLLGSFFSGYMEKLMGNERTMFELSKGEKMRPGRENVTEQKKSLAPKNKPLNWQKMVVGVSGSDPDGPFGWLMMMVIKCVLYVESAYPHFVTAGLC